MEKGWNISFWVKNMEGQVFAKIFQWGQINSNGAWHQYNYFGPF